jgi:hypothetical protein
MAVLGVDIMLNVPGFRPLKEGKARKVDGIMNKAQVRMSLKSIFTFLEV